MALCHSVVLASYPLSPIAPGFPPPPNPEPTRTKKKKKRKRLILPGWDAVVTRLRPPSLRADVPGATVAVVVVVEFALELAECPGSSVACAVRWAAWRASINLSGHVSCSGEEGISPENSSSTLIVIQGLTLNAPRFQDGASSWYVYT